MRALDLIRKKRDGLALSVEELAFLIQGYCSGDIPDYQISALLMAVFFRGLTDEEMAGLTRVMQYSGTIFDLSSIPGRKVDKHSTGGVGDKTSLVVAPALAAAGVIVPMIAGRGLGHTGGTLDKLESIPGFNVRLSPSEFTQMLSQVGASLIGQTPEVVPADRKLYALRDVTATIESRPLIAASIMSKKLAEGIDGLVLDVKTGSGAFMKDLGDAERLARAMVDIGKSCGKQVVALITDMNQPLGQAVGNSLEVIECIEVLKGNGPADLVALCREISAHGFVAGEVAETLEEGRTLFWRLIRSGQALAKFSEIVRFQGGDVGIIDDYGRLPQAQYRAAISASVDGFVLAIDTEAMGNAMSVLGAGRETVSSVIDPAVGMTVHKKIGDFVQCGEALCTVFYNDADRFEDAKRRLARCYRFSPERVEAPELIKTIIS